VVVSEREGPGGAAILDLVEALPVAVVVADADHRVRIFNAAAETLYGHRRADAMGADVVDLLFEADDREAAAELFDSVLSAGARRDGEPGRPWEGDRRVRRRDGTLLVSSFLLVPVGGAVAWIATDGMDQGLAEQERSVLLSAEHAARATAEEALALLEALLASAPVAIALFDAQLQYARVNDAYAALSGLPPEDHVGGIGEVAGPPVEMVTDLRRVLMTGRTIVGRQVELPGSGPSRHFSVSYFPVRTASGTAVGAGMACVEITKLKRAEEDRAASLAEAEAARRRMAIIAAASTVLTATMDVDEQLVRLTRALVPAAAEGCAIALFGSAGVRPEHTAAAGTAGSGEPERGGGDVDELAAWLRSTAPAAGGAVAEVLRTGLARLVPAAGIAELWGGPRPAGAGTPSPCIVAPLETREGMRGVLLLSSGGQRSLDDDDVDLAVEVASRAALAIGNARAFQQEHEIAETLQRAMLPATVPSTANVDLAVRYVAAADGASVGGDWYDVLPFDDGSAAVVVGDVVGHDVAASTAMGQLRSALRAYAYEGPSDPAAVLGRLERVFEPLGLTYATCVLGTFDAQGSSFRWSNAGHPPPLLVRAGRGTLCEEAAGLMLGVGVGTGAGREEATIGLEPGDVLVLYTDGLVERRGEALGEGLERLVAAAPELVGLPAPAVCDRLVAALGPARASLHDDVAILVGRVVGEPPSGDVHRLAFEPTPDAAGVLRGYTAGVLAGRGWEGTVDTAVLLVSELVTNVVRHASGPCALAITFLDGMVELAVEDSDPRTPTPRSADPLDEAGRGLLMVEALAAAWGVRRLPGGKATWLTVRRS
jgi:PAS domain S-box-containing protein